MEHNQKKFGSIQVVLNALNETNDINEIIGYENQITCMITSPIMFLGSILNYIIGYLVLHNNLSETLLNCIFFLVMGVLFEVIRRVKFNVEKISVLIAVLFSIWFLYMVKNTYVIVGPAVWMIACIQIVLSMSRIKKNMSIIIGTVTVFTSIYIIFNSDKFQFELNILYFIPQSILLIVLLFVLSIVHKINTDRYSKLHTQLQTMIEQKEEITSLYEEIAVTHEELYEHNSQLRTYTDIIEKRDRELYDLAYYDVLTKLPNRKMFMEQLNSLIDIASQQNFVFYVVFIDVDSFKKINDTKGHHVGDLFLSKAADRLKKSIMEGDLLGRIGGDEFALVISRKINKFEVLQEIVTIRDSFSLPFKINNLEMRLTASFGISVFPNDGDNAVEILKSADLSMYKAKELGKNNVQFFSNHMKDEVVGKTDMEHRLLHALDHHEFFLVFQPQYYIQDKTIRGFEALLRWKSPELGIVNPMQFIPLAEEIGLIGSLGEWVLRTACYKFKDIYEKYGLEVLISVNISAIQLRDRNFVDCVKSILDETSLDPKYLELEVTESVFIESFHNAIHLLEELKDMGVRIALDDFGTGYSSLSYLKLLPIDTLKIDKTFVDDITDDASQVQIVGDIISLAHNLGVTVIAEGVEYNHQLEYLRDYSCDFVQGYLLGRPLAEDSLEVLLNNLKN